MTELDRPNVGESAPQRDNQPAREPAPGLGNAPVGSRKSLQGRLFAAMREPHDALQETPIFRNLTGAAPVLENLITVTRYNLALYLGVKAELDRRAHRSDAVSERLERRVTQSLGALQRDLLSLGIPPSEIAEIAPMAGIPPIETRGDVLVYSFMVEGSNFGTLAFRKKMQKAFGVNGRPGGGAEFMHAYRSKVTLLARGMLPLRSALIRVPDESGEHARMERQVHALMHKIFEAFRDAPTVHAA